jgi:hypothetical protein
MSYRIAISFAAAAIGISCIATDALARGGKSGGPTGGPSFTSSGVSASKASSGSGGFASGSQTTKGGSQTTKGGSQTTKPIYYPGGLSPTLPPPGGPAAGAAGRARYYAPASYDSTAACGRYPYPPCKKAPTR